MDTLPYILNGFAVSMQPWNLWYTFVGVFLGTVIGVLPGIGPSAGIALLIPMTFGMEPTSALIMMAGIYYGAKYGGSATAILIRTPGEAASVMTSLDGYQMALKGRAGAALAVAAIGSFIAGTLGVILLSIFAIPLSALSLMFGPAEYFMLMLFAMMSISALMGGTPGRGIMSAIIGLMIASIGMDLQTGRARHTMGLVQLMDEVNFLVVIVGLFAVAEVFRNFERMFKGSLPPVVVVAGKLWLTREEWRRSIGPIFRGGLLGFVIGVLPGAGGSIASMLSYVMEKRLSKNPGEFGHGAIEGVAGPEAANNSDTAGAMVPLLTLGVPGGGTTAVLMGAFIMYGIQPGPLLFANNPDLVWGLINSMYVGNVMLLILNLPLIGLFVKLLYVPPRILFPAILAISAIGVYSINSSVFDLYMMLFFGVVGYGFGKLNIPVAPMVLAVVLGGMMEQSFRQAMTISGGSPQIFVGSPVTQILALVSLASLVAPYVARRIRARSRLVAPNHE